MTGREDSDAVIAALLIRAGLERIGYTIKPGDIVLIRTGLDNLFYWRKKKTSDWFNRSIGIGSVGPVFRL